MPRLLAFIKTAARNWLAVFLIIVPSALKIPIYRRMFGYQIGRNVRIGLCWINVPTLKIGNHVHIGHLTRFKNIPDVEIGDYCNIGFGNTFTSAYEFTSEAGIKARANRPCLNLGKHCQITLLHYFDVQDSLQIGAYTVVAGRESAFFTHYLDVITNKQATKPITIGDYCMIGSHARFVPGACIPSCCVVGMAAVVTKPFDEGYCLIAGNPARVLDRYPADSAYFKRTVGWIGEFAPVPPELRELG